MRQLPSQRPGTRLRPHCHPGTQQTTRGSGTRRLHFLFRTKLRASSSGFETAASNTRKASCADLSAAIVSE